MLTFLIVLACVVAHTLAGAATRYFVERVLEPSTDDVEAIFANLGCALVWPLVLLITTMALASQLAHGKKVTWETEALANRKKIVELTAVIEGLKVKPPVQGVHR